MNFDPTISLGAIIALVGFIVTTIIVSVGFVRRMAALETKVDAMWRWFEVKIEAINGGRGR